MVTSSSRLLLPFTIPNHGSNFVVCLQQICCIMKRVTGQTKPFDTKKSIQNASDRNTAIRKWKLVLDDKEYVWTNKMERVGIIREGIPYNSLEVVSKRL